MNFAPFNVLEFDGAFPQPTIASWLPTFTQPGRLIIRDMGFGTWPIKVGVLTTKSVPDPFRGTSARTGPDPSRGTAIRDPPGIVSSPFVFAYQAPPAPPSNAGFKLLSVPDPRRGTSTPLSRPPTIFVPPLTWQPTIIQPGRIPAAVRGTDLAAAFWPIPGTSTADRWQPTTVQPARQPLYAAGTDLVRPVGELIFADKWSPTWTQPSRTIAGTAGTSSVIPVWTLDTVADLAVCEGRLTLVSGSPLGNGSGTTLYFTPFRGNLIGFQQGQIISFSETSIAIPVSTGVYDVFAYNNSGTLALEFSSAWSVTGDGTGANGTRTNAISLTNGIYYKSSDATRRYLGTIYSASGTSSDISGAIGTKGLRHVWNYYNRTRKVVLTIESTFTWNYAVATWRPINNNANDLSSFKVVCGVQEDLIEIAALGSFVTRTDAGRFGIGVGYDTNSTTTSSFSGVGITVSGVTSSTEFGYTFSDYNIQENIGLHTFWAVEQSISTSSIDIYADGSGTEIHAIHWC